MGTFKNLKARPNTDSKDSRFLSAASPSALFILAARSPLSGVGNTKIGSLFGAADDAPIYEMRSETIVTVNFDNIKNEKRKLSQSALYVIT
jgi:hypothetical protein